MTCYKYINNKIKLIYYEKIKLEYLIDFHYTIKIDYINTIFYTTTEL